MNVLGHTFVALRVGDDDPGYVLGAVLPDLAPMLGLRLHRDRVEGRVKEGVRCHVDADAAFHANAQFRAGSAALRRDLTASGLGRGPAWAVGHAGWELLLDGTLVTTNAETAYWSALDAGDLVLDAIARPDRGRWLGFLAHRLREPRPILRYDDPTWVAERLYAVLCDRPLLRVLPDQLPDVTQVLDHHAPRVAAVASEVLATTVRAI